MSNLSLDQWGVLTPTNEMKKPLILSDAHAFYVYEQSPERILEKVTQNQIDGKLEEERLELKNHKDYVGKNYIRVGGN